jgi:hypothetical protein
MAVIPGMILFSDLKHVPVFATVSIGNIPYNHYLGTPILIIGFFAGGLAFQV